jgi:nicotinate-nucleotide adenylyltransferase
MKLLIFNELRLLGLPAVFGGTFDPFHEGHKQLLIKTAEQFQFAPYIIVPAGQPPHKDRPRTSDTDRIAGIQNLLGPDARFVISGVELSRPGPHYAIDTLRLLKADTTQKA